MVKTSNHSFSKTFYKIFHHNTLYQFYYAYLTTWKISFPKDL